MLTLLDLKISWLCLSTVVEITDVYCHALLMIYIYLYNEWNVSFLKTIEKAECKEQFYFGRIPGLSILRLLKAVMKYS